MKNYLVDIDWFDHHFTGDFLYENHKVKEVLNEPRFKIGDEDISSRVLLHWHEMGILEDDREKGKGWRKFSISEMIWIGIVIKLRTFGLDLKKIKKIREYLNTYNSKNISKCPLLDFYIAFSANSEMPVKLLVFSSGEALIGRQVAIDSSLQLGLISEDYVTIDISNLVKSKLNFKKIETDYLAYSLTNIEKEVSKAINIDKVKSIQITLKDDFILLSKEHITESKDEIKALLNKIGNYYESSTIKNERSTHYRFIEKKKIKN